MKLSSRELAQILEILDKIDRGLTPPRAGDRLGRFLRQYARARTELDLVLAQHTVTRRADRSVSGISLAGIDVHDLAKPHVHVLPLPLGEAAVSLVLSEELGSVTTLRMWLKGPVANAAYDVLGQYPSLRMTGDFRWTPPGQLTPGEASLDAALEIVPWQSARCLKAVADDLLRPPHALEYVLDYELGPPGLKYFRCVCARRRARTWEVLPAFDETRPLEIVSSDRLDDLSNADLAALLIYREPWSAAWTVGAASSIVPEDVLAHAIAWADFGRELSGEEWDPRAAAAIRETLRGHGVAASSWGHPRLTRNLLPLARDVLRWLKGMT